MDNRHNGHSNLFTITTFESFDELARMTLPYLLKGAIALSGGSTYERLFPLWSKLKPDCSASTFFPVDERLVDFDDPSSNWGTAYREFLSRIGKSEDKRHFTTGAEQYRALLKTHSHTDVPIFDAVFLGVGNDGHTASLFPGMPYLDDLNSVVIETASPKPPFQRVTLAIAPLVAAKKLIVIIAGQNKKPIVERIFKNDASLPIVRVITRRKGSLLFLEKELVS